MAFALRANCGPRWLSGFLTMFMAFLLRENPIGGWEHRRCCSAIVIGAAGARQHARASSSARCSSGSTRPLTVVLALAGRRGVAAGRRAVLRLVALALLGLTAGLAQSLAKLSLDSTIQRDVPERVQASAFARSDTTLQLAWVIGGFVGIAMPLMPRLGLGVCGVLAAGASCWSPPCAGRCVTAGSGTDAAHAARAASARCGPRAES